jgi:two-component system, OmpR family, phosphate regulon sensor histidine kinase PhoR
VGVNSIAYFFIGLAVGLLVWGADRVRHRKRNTEKEIPAPVPDTAAPSSGDDERAVFIPGRNFEQMLQRLGSGHSMLNVVLNSMGEGVLLLNQAGRVVLMNPSAERILGLSQKDSLGRHFLEVVRHPSLAGLLAESKEPAEGRGGPASGEIELPGKEEKTFAVSAASIRSEGADILGQIVVFSDISSMKRLMRMRTEFMANVSHELKTPLTAILGYVETLLSGAMEDKKNRAQFLRKISDQTQRLHALILDVLELSRIESGAGLEKSEAVDLAETVARALEILKAKAEARGIRVVLEIPADAKVVGFKDGLLHVLENLLDNAIKFSPPESRVRVYSKAPAEGWVELSVADQGPGIPVEAQSRIFERFFRVDVSRSREAGGTGLGLSIVKHLVERMGGRVTLQSREGEGSVFTVTLPAAERSFPHPET